MVILLIIGVTALTLMLINSNKVANQISIKSQADKDVDKIIASVQNLLLTPDSCNANFFGQSSISGTLSTIKKCISGCTGSAGSNAIALNVSNSNWNTFQGEAPSRARITSASYTVGAQTNLPAPLTLTLSIQKNLGNLNATTFTQAPKTYQITAYVVIGTYTLGPPAAYNASPTIIGCARNSSSTLKY